MLCARHEIEAWWGIAFTKYSAMGRSLLELVAAIEARDAERDMQSGETGYPYPPCPRCGEER